MRRSFPFYLFLIILAAILYAVLYMGAKGVERFVLESSVSNILSLTGNTMVGSNTKKFPVTKVVDGDTLEVQTPIGLEKVRLIGIDTPETKKPGVAEQCYGAEATTRLKELVENKSVILEADTTQDDKDRYGRLLRYVRTDEDFVNLRMVEGGFAREYTYQKQYIYQKLFKDSQIEAQRFYKGLWGECPLPFSFALYSLPI